MQRPLSVSVGLAVSLALVAAAPSLAQGVLTLQKSTNGMDADAPPGPVLPVGSTVTWTYVVRNTSARQVTSVAVTDDQGVMVSCPQTSLDGGESMTCTASGTALAGQYANLGTVTGVQGLAMVSASDPSHYFGQAPGVVTLQKSTNGVDADTAPGPTVAVGSTVSWTYEVTNIGSNPLDNVAVTDDQGVMVSCPSTTLAAGLSMTCAASGTATAGQYANLGAVTATLPDDTVVGASDPSHYFGAPFTLEKSTNGEDADTPPGPTIMMGDPVDWTYVVTNSGGLTVSNIVVTDDQGVVVSCPGTSLAPGTSMTCTASGMAVAGQYANVGTATGDLERGGMVSATDPSHYFGQAPPVVQVPALTPEALALLGLVLAAAALWALGRRAG